jgi:hypothetical protein
MSVPITRRWIALLTAAGALLLAALAVAPQAEAATIYACVKKKSGSARIVSKKAKCKKGESKLSWNSEGPAGRNGVNGANGSNGKDGAQGKEGIPGPFGETLPSGKSETGVYALEGSSSVIQSGWGYPFALASAPTFHFIVDGATPPAQCPGSVKDPKAVAGHLCVYEGTAHGGTITSKGVFNPENESFSTASRFGFGFNINNSTPGSNAWSQGTWAVTAP